MQLSLQQIVGGSYADFWKTKKRYRVCKGSRGSKKSKTTALNMIYRMLEYPESNGLCVRRYSNTLRDSVYSDLKWAIHRLGLDGHFDCIDNHNRNRIRSARIRFGCVAVPRHPQSREL